MAKEDDAPAAEAAEGEDVKPLDDEGEGKKGLTAKKLLMIIIPVLVLGIAVALYFSGILASGKEGGGDGEHVEAGMEGGEHGEGAGVPGAIFMEVPDLLVNLSGTGGQARFLKLKVKLEVSSPED